MLEAFVDVDVPSYSVSTNYDRYTARFIMNDLFSTEDDQLCNGHDLTTEVKKREVRHQKRCT